MNLLSFGKTVTSLRTKRDLTQKELAKKAGIERTFLNKIENGEKNISLLTASKLAEALNVEIGAMLEYPNIEGIEGMGQRKYVKFLKLGGTWDMEKIGGALRGSGPLDDSQLAKLEKEADFDEEKILQSVKKIFQKQEPTKEVGVYLSWAKKMRQFIKGPFIPLFSGDSSHYRNSLYAVVLEYILKELKNHPNVPLLIGLGTDTADILLPLLDAFLFNADVHPVLVTGANRSHFEKNSDASSNFNDLAWAAHLHLKPGAYYVFQHMIYRGGDVVKIDPREEPQLIEGMMTFFSPHRTQMKLGLNDVQHFYSSSPIFHAEKFRTWSAEQIYEAMQKILIIHLGHMNDIESEIERMLDPRYRVVIIQAHALGNGSLPIQRAIEEARRKGKMVMIVSRCLVPATNRRYHASFTHIHGVIDGQLLSFATARALVLRSLLEKRSEKKTQALIAEYVRQCFTAK